LLDKRIFQIGNIVAVILTIIVNSLANALPIGGKTTGELSDNIPNLFVPAGITFAIWGVIYFLIILFAIYQARDLFRKEKIDMPYLEKISFFFISASLSNIIWIFLWHYEQIILSLLLMLVLFVSLLMIYLRLDIGKNPLSVKDKFMIHVPISVYIGWITIATVANMTAALVSINWDGFGISGQIWTVLVIIIAAIITLLMLITRKDCAYAAVVIWAFLGIYLKRSANDPIFGMQNQIAYIALICIFTILIVMLYSFYNKYKYYKKENMLL